MFKIEFASSCQHPLMSDCYDLRYESFAYYLLYVLFHISSYQMWPYAQILQVYREPRGGQAGAKRTRAQEDQNRHRRYGMLLCF